MQHSYDNDIILHAITTDEKSSAGKEKNGLEHFVATPSK